MTLSRRKFIELASAFGATLALRSRFTSATKLNWTERRDLFPEGVASGDPHSDSVILWTRRPPFGSSEAHRLTVEVAEDAHFKRVVAHAITNVSGKTDWTCRVLAAGLKPRTVYWYRFTDEHGFGSRLGRTITAPSNNDTRPVSFTFVSCQMVPAGACNAYRRMIWEDEQRPFAEQLGFVLHLGDFVYEVVWYPEDRAQYYARKLRDVIRRGKRFATFTCRQSWTTIARYIAATFPIPICRTRARVGRLSACGTITNSRGKDGKASRTSQVCGPPKHEKLPRTRHGLNISPRESSNQIRT